MSIDVFRLTFPNGWLCVPYLDTLNPAGATCHRTVASGLVWNCCSLVLAGWLGIGWWKSYKVSWGLVSNQRQIVKSMRTILIINAKYIRYKMRIRSWSVAKCMVRAKPAVAKNDCSFSFLFSLHGPGDGKNQTSLRLFDIKWVYEQYIVRLGPSPNLKLYGKVWTKAEHLICIRTPPPPGY